MEDKIILKFKTKNILNFYEIEPRIEIIITGIRAHICQVSRFWRNIPILDPPQPKLGRSDFHFLMIKKKNNNNNNRPG